MNQTAKNTIKILIILLSFGFIYYKLANYEDLKTTLNEIYLLKKIKIFIILGVLLLMPINWSIEAIKWKFLLKKIEELSFIKSLQGVFIGVTSGFFTPNRIGEPGGRILFLKRANRINGFFCTGVGSMAQLLITIITGLIFLSIFVFQFPFITNKIHLSPFIISSISLISIIISLSVYLNFSNIAKFILKIKFLTKWNNYFDALTKYSKKDLVIILLYSILRYLIFSTQFYFLFLVFNIELTILQSYGSISLIYFFSSFIPSITLTEFGIRGSTGIIIINFFSTQNFAIISASIILWLINLTIPALIGIIMFYKSKI